MTHVLVVNAGSSSLKYQLVDAESGDVAASGLIEKIAEPEGHTVHKTGGETFELNLPIADHEAAFSLLLKAFARRGPLLGELDIAGVGHRVVHGGSHFPAPAVVDDEVVAKIEDLIPLAPLHNPGALEGIRVARATFPDLPQVCVFDTSFHMSIPDAAATYALPRRWREEFQVKRYGAHGTSHDFVSARAAELLGTPREQANVIVLHLGNGASACAVSGGRSVETSMGLSPLEGLVMGTRSGDVDASIAAHLHRMGGLGAEDVDRGLNRESGLKGLAGTNDWREVNSLRDEGNPDAALAFDVYVHRIVKYVGAYAAVLGHVDAIAFTAGVGEHSPALRAAVLERLDILGVELDAQANADAHTETLITTPGSRVAAYVIPTNEELAIARATVAAVRG